jgi:threonine synthase
VVTASSGNAGAAIAAYCAAVGLSCLLLLEPGAPPARLRQALATGAKVLSVEGVFSHGPKASGDLILDLASALNYYPGFIWAPVNPYLMRSMKSISCEVVDQLSAFPEVVLSPVGGGDLFAGAGFKDSKLAEKESQAISTQNPVPFDVKAIIAEVRK